MKKQNKTWEANKKQAWDQSTEGSFYISFVFFTLFLPLHLSHIRCHPTTSPESLYECAEATLLVADGEGGMKTHPNKYVIPSSHGPKHNAQIIALDGEQQIRRPCTEQASAGLGNYLKAWLCLSHTILFRYQSNALTSLDRWHLCEGNSVLYQHNANRQ